MAENIQPVEPTEAASALSAVPPPTTPTKAGLWGRLSLIQKLSAVVSGGVVTVVGGYAGYSKLTTKPPAPENKQLVAAKPAEEPREPVKNDTPPDTVPNLKFDELPAVPTINTPKPRGAEVDLPLIAPPPIIVGDRPKPMMLKDDFASVKVPDIAPPKELPANLQNMKTDAKDVPILRVGGVEETAPPPKKTDIDLPMLPPLLKTPDVTLPPIPGGLKEEPPLISPPGLKKEEPPLISPPGLKKEEPPLISPPGLKKEEPPLIAPPTLKKEEPPLIAPPTLKKEEPPLIAPPGLKKEEPPLINPPSLTLPKDPTMPPPRMIDPISIEPKNLGMPESPMITVPPRKDIKDPPSLEPLTPMPPLTPMAPKKESYEEDWHTPKPGDTYAMISREYYKTPDYAAALEAYNKTGNKAGERIIRVPPPWVLEEKFPTLAGKTEKPVLPTLDPRTPGIKYEPVEPPQPPMGSPTTGTPRPAPLPAVAPATARTDEYRVNNPAGESIREIARKVYGTPDAWKRLYELNPSLDPTQAIPEGTTLRIGK